MIFISWIYETYISCFVQQTPPVCVPRYVYLPLYVFYFVLYACLLQTGDFVQLLMLFFYQHFAPDGSMRNLVFTFFISKL